MQKEMTKALEKGHIYFFYRPKVAKEEVGSLDDVQRFYMILKPFSTGDGKGGGAGKTRLIIITRKKLPNIDDRSRYWGFVRATVDDVEELSSYLEEEKYETKTRGTREVGVSRPVGQGVYAIVVHNEHSHLAYILTLPREPGSVQEEFNITKSGSYIISVKNPEAPNPPQAGLGKGRKAEFPEHLLEAFRGRRFISLGTTEFLDHVNCEILLIGASEDVLGELGDVGEELEQMEEEDEAEITKLGEENAIFDELKLDSTKFPIDALRGDWV